MRNLRSATIKNPFVWAVFTTLTVITLLTGGCVNLYRGTITLTAAVDSASKEYATLKKGGFVTAELHAKVEAAHAKYNQACGVAKDALVAYKLSGDPVNYRLTFEAARVAANEFLTLIWPLLDASQGKTLQKQINTAEAL